MSARNYWSFKCGLHGSRVRVRERRPGGSVYLEAWDARINGYRKRSLGFGVRKNGGQLDPKLAARAKAEAYALADRLAIGDPLEEVLTLGFVVALFMSEKLPHLKPRYRRDVGRYLAFLESFLGPDFVLANLGPREWEAITRALLSGDVDHSGRRSADAAPVGVQTVRKTLKVLRQLCLFATSYRRRNGRFLLTVDPTRGLKLPSAPDPARPVASDERVAALLTVAHDVHEHLPGLIVLARDTGRRIGAITRLRYADWLPELGTYGSLRWRADSDKLGRTTVVPVTPAVRDVVENIRRTRAGVGDAYLFPAPKSEGPVKVPLCNRWLRRAEELAGLPHVHMGGFHALRRAWATKRKQLSLKDVAAAGGWKGTQVLQSLYQQADVDTLEEVVLGGRELRAVVRSMEGGR